MTADGFLSVLSIGIAVVALMSPVARMKAQLSIQVQVILAIIFGGFVIYLQLFSAAGRPCAFASNLCRVLAIDPPRTLNPEQLSFVLVLVWMGLAICVHRFTRPWANALPTISGIVDTLLHDRKYDDLIQFLTPHMRFVRIAAERKLLLQRLHDWLDALNLKPRAGIYTPSPPPGTKVKPRSPQSLKVRLLFSNLKHVVPAERRYEEVARSIVTRITRSDPLRGAIVADRPYFALLVLPFEVREKFDFCDACFRDFMADRASVFYHEMKVPLETSTTEGFKLDPLNRLQGYLFTNCGVAENLGIWQPIGDYTAELLSGEHGQ